MPRISRKLPLNKYQAALLVCREFKALRSQRFKSSESKQVLAERYRCSKSSIDGYLKILLSTSYVKRLIKEELIPFGVANKIIFTSLEIQDEIARKAYLNKLTQSEVGKLIRESRSQVTPITEVSQVSYLPSRDELNQIEDLVERHGVTIRILGDEFKIILSTYDPSLGRDLMWSGGFINSNLRCETTTSDIAEPLIALKIVIYAANEDEMGQAISVIFDAFLAVEKLVLAREKIKNRKS